jgi:type I restriction enzyme S subunit
LTDRVTLAPLLDIEVVRDRAALRSAILGLALCGRLLEQRKADESAHCLLGRLKAGSLVTPPEDEARTLPESWAWANLGDIADCVLGKMLDQAKHTSGRRWPYLRNINVRWNGFDLADLREMYFKDDELERYGVRVGDVLICEGGEPGRAAVWTDRDASMLIQKAIHRVRLRGGIEPRWLVLNLRYDASIGRLRRWFTGATIQHLTGKALSAYSIRLPPLAEQKRIVAKVDQLMTLCDDLEAKQNKKRALATQSTRSALTALTTAETDADLVAAWKRVQTHFQDFVSRPDDVVLLRRAAIELAVRGRMVGPSGSDGSGRDLLTHILEERRKSGKSKTPRQDEANVAEAAQPFLVPEHWAWTSWRDLLSSSEAGWSPQCASRPRTGDEWGVLKVSAVSWDRFDPDENKALLPGVNPRLECAVQVGDFLMSRANTAALVGRSVVVSKQPTRLLMSDKTVRCHFSSLVDRSFMNYYNRTDTARQHYIANASGTSDSMKNISRDVILNMPAPLPPLGEQERIVAKLDQLMSLLDDLEAKLRKQEETATRLAESLAAAVPT